MKSALDLTKEFCDAVFAKRDATLAVSCLTDDIEWFGISDSEDVFNKAQAFEFIEKNISINPSPYAIRYLQESNTLTGEDTGISFAKLSIETINASLNCRITCATRIENNESKICAMHMSISNSFIKDNEYFPLTITSKKIKQIRDDLLNSTVSGGMMGAYTEQGFPFYFVNKRMIALLGYNSESEFVEDIGGYIINCIHQNDKQAVYDEIENQLKNSQEYSIEYRMKTIDGSYKWIHEIGRIMVAENGKQAITSMCYDIDQQKKAEIELHQIKNKLKIAINHAGLTYWEYDIKNNCAYMNSISTEKYNLEEVLKNYPQSVYDSGVIHKESILVYQELIDEIKSGKETASADIKTVDRQGKIIWKRARFTALFDEYNKPFWAIATAESIDEYKKLEQQFSLAAEQTKIEIWIYDFINKSVTITAQASDSYGIKKVLLNVPQNLINLGIIHPDDTNSLIEMHKRMENGESKVSCMLRLRMIRVNEWITYKIDYTVIYDKNGLPERAIGTGINISEKQRLVQIYEQESTFDEAFNDERLVFAVLININKGKIEKRIKSCAFLGNISLATEYTEQLHEICKDIPESQNQKFYEKFNIDALRKAVENGKNTIEYSFLITDKNGLSSIFITAIKFVKNPYNDEIMGLMSTKDITSETMYKMTINSVVENFYDFIVDIDINKDIYTMISYKNNLKNIPPKHDKFTEINNKYAKTFLDEESTKECTEKLSIDYAKKRLETENSYSFKYRIEEDGEIRIKKIRVFYISKEMGHIGFTGADITELFKDEALKNDALKHALNSSQRASNAKTAFLSRMSHDIRTPMNAIIGMTALSKQEVSDPKKISENLEVIDSSSQHLLKIINDILDMSQIESGSMVLAKESFDCFTECNSVFEMASVAFQEKKQKFTIEKSIIHRNFIGDIVRLKRVIINLLNNASKFTPEGGKIKLILKETPSSNTKIAMLTFAVIDSGCGIPKEQLETIFEPFTKLNSSENIEGTGLGLSIVKSIVQVKGGTINVESIPGKGSTFTVVVPLEIDNNDKLLEKKKVKNKNIKADFSKLKVLLIEDQPVNIIVAKKMLEKFGAEVDTAENGSIGYDKFSSSENGRYNMIFMDVQMPVMNGYESTKAIRNSGHLQAKTIPIIAMTANAYAQDIKISLDSGMNAHIAKPISVGAIATAINKVLKKDKKNISN